jgi:hypothetical protein
MPFPETNTGFQFDRLAVLNRTALVLSGGLSDAFVPKLQDAYEPVPREHFALSSSCGRM